MDCNGLTTLNNFEQIMTLLRADPKRWLITGVAGFIGSNLLEFLLDNDQIVVGLDNFSTGYRDNLTEVKTKLGAKKWANFFFVEGDIQSMDSCQAVCTEVDYVLHQAALGSVPGSLQNPIATNKINIDGFLNMLVAARDAQVKKFVYASSSSIYGDDLTLPKVENKIGNPLSPYAITKYVNELYANLFFNAYDLKTIGLRYFNVFGQRQDPQGAYAAVIPKWITAMIQNEPIHMYGDGQTSRDFCFIENVIQANVLAAMASEQFGEVYNIAVNDSSCLNTLFSCLKHALAEHGVYYTKEPTYLDFRKGDIKNSCADISKAKQELSYNPLYKVEPGIEKTILWYLEKIKL